MLYFLNKMEIFNRWDCVVYETKYCKIYAKVTGIMYNKRKEKYFYSIDMPQFRKDYYSMEEIRKATYAESWMFY